MSDDDQPPERDVKDFKFQQLCKVRMKDNPDTLPTGRVSLITSSSTYGLTFVGVDTGFKVLKTEDFVKKDSGHTADRLKYVIPDFPIVAEVDIGSQVEFLSLSCDDLTLAVTTTNSSNVLALMFDVRSFAGQVTSPVSEFLKVNLGPSDSPMLDMAWNPVIPTLLVTCMTGGKLTMYDITSTLTIKATANTKAKCVCWSPRGKQLVVGQGDGTLVQFDPDLKEKRKWEYPSILPDTSYEVFNVTWLSTYTFIAAYVSSAADCSDQPTLVMINGSKDGPVSYISFEDVCYGSGEERKRVYYFNYLQKWDMVLMASSNSSEIGIMGRHLSHKQNWERWNLDDAARAECPLTDSYTDTFPMGFTIDFSSNTPISLGDDKSYPASPLLLVLSTEGVIIPYHMMYTHKEAPGVTAAAQVLNTTGVRAGAGATRQAAAPKPPASAVKNLFGTGDASTGKPAPTSLFGSLPGAAGTPKSGDSAGQPFIASSASTGTSSTGSTGFSFGGSQQTENKAGSFSFSTTTAPTGTSSAGTGSFSFASTPGLSITSTVTGTSTTGSGPTSAATTTGSLFSFPNKSSGAFAFSGSQSSGSGPTFSFTQSQSADSNVSDAAPESASVSHASTGFNFGTKSSDPSFAFKALSTATTTASKPPPPFTAPAPFSSTPKSGSTAAPAFAFSKAGDSSTGIGGVPPAASVPSSVLPSFGSTTGSTFGSAAPSFGQSTASGFGLSAVGKAPTASPVLGTEGVPKFGAQVGVTPTGSTASSVPSAALGTAKPPQNLTAQTKGSVATSQGSLPTFPGGPSALPKYEVSSSGTVFGASAKPGGGLSAGQTTELPTTTAGHAILDDTFSQSILEEIQHFEKELGELRSRSAVSEVKIGSQKEMKFLRQQAEEMQVFSAEIKKNVEEQNKDVQEQTSMCLDMFAMAEECRTREKLNTDPKFQHLLKSRSLDPASAEKFQQLQLQYQVLDQGLRDVDLILDTQWEEYQNNKKNKSNRMKYPTNDTLYRALKSNHTVIQVQRKQLRQLEERLKQLKLYNTHNNWSNSSQQTPELSSLADSLLSTSPVKEPSNVSEGSAGYQTGSSVNTSRLARLRDHLYRRHVPVIRSTKPENLSMSRLIVKGREKLPSQSGSTSAAQKPGVLPTGAGAFAGMHRRSTPGMQKKTTDSHPQVTAAPSTGQGMTIFGQTAGQAKAPIFTGLASNTTSKPAADSKFSGKPSLTSGVAPHTFGSTGMRPTFGSSLGTLGSQQVPSVAPSNPKVSQVKASTVNGIKLEDITPSGSENDVDDTEEEDDEYDEDEDSTGSNDLGQGAEVGFGLQYMSSATGAAGFTSTPVGLRPQTQQSVQDSPKATGAAASSTPVSRKLFGSEGSKPGLGVADKPAAEGAAFTFGQSKGFAFGSATTTTASSISTLLGSTSSAPSSGFTFGSTSTSTPVSAAKSEATALGSDEFSFGVGGGSSTFSFGGQSVTSTTSSAPTSAPRAPSSQSPSTPSTGSLFGQSAASGASTVTEGGQRVTSPTDASTSSSSSTSTSVSAATTASTAGGGLTGTATASSGGTGPGPTSSTSTASPFTGGLFGQAKSGAPTTASSSIGFGMSSTGGLFGQATSSSSAVKTGGLFGQAASSTSKTSGLFGQSTVTTASTSNGVSQSLASTSTTSSGGLFGQSTTSTASTSSSGGLFGQSIASTVSTPSSGGLFGQASVSTASMPSSGGLFGQSIASTVSTPSSGGLCGQATVSTASMPSSGGLFGQSSTSTASTPSSGGLFGQSTTSTASTTSSGGTFGQSLVSTASTPSSGGLFGQATASTASTPSSGGLFGQSAPSTTASGLFGQASTANSSGFGFGQTSTSTTGSSGGLFGQAVTTSSGGGLFGQPASSGSGLFGQQTSTSSGLFGQSAAVSSSGGLFGAAPSSSSGGLFGQSGTGAFGSTATSSSGFGASTSGTGFGFGQTSSAGFGTPAFGQSPGFGQTASTPGFGQSGSEGGGGGGLFSGLGGKPSAEKASTNVFGSGQTFGAGQSSGGLFGSSSATTFGSASSPASSSGGPFSGGGSGAFSSGSGVSATGFSSLQQQPASGGFGSPPAFGGSPAFGSSAFGSAPKFGGGGFGTAPTFGSSPAGGTFGSTGSGGGFAGFASAGSPTFGSLAQSSEVPTFGSLSQQPAASEGFGGAVGGGFGSPSFGGGQQQPQGFGNSSFGSSPSFTGYRG